MTKIDRLGRMATIRTSVSSGPKVAARSALGEPRYAKGFRTGTARVRANKTGLILGEM